MFNEIKINSERQLTRHKKVIQWYILFLSKPFFAGILESSGTFGILDKAEQKLLSLEAADGKIGGREVLLLNILSGVLVHMTNKILVNWIK